jgi:hypothetical protein
MDKMDFSVIQSTVASGKRSIELVLAENGSVQIVSLSDFIGATYLKTPGSLLKLI